MLRMRTLDAAFEEIKKLDPQTSITKFSLRKILLSGEVPTVRVGRLRLVDMANLTDYLRGGSEDY